MRNTPQKKIIKEYLESVTSHPTADVVYEAVKVKLPNISKGTVYRILNSFVNKGHAQEIVSEVSHFDGDTSKHAHLICRKCGSVHDIFDNTTKVRFNKDNDFGQIDDYQLNFYGTCKECLAK